MPPFDMDAVFETAAATRTCLEIHCQPLRAGLTDAHIRLAAQRGVMLTLGSGAQRIRDMASMALGVTAARRGWAETRHLLNTRPLPAVRQFLKGKRAGRAPTFRDRYGNLKTGPQVNEQFRAGAAT